MSSPKQCRNCNTTTAANYHPVRCGKFLCDNCHYQKLDPTRYKPRKRKPQNKNRRKISKQDDPKKEPSNPCDICVDALVYKSQVYQVGDVVSVYDMDDDDGSVVKYYAQCTHLLIDKHLKKFIGFNWLLPKPDTAFGEFDADSFVIGPTQDLFYPMDAVEFVSREEVDRFEVKRALPHFIAKKKPMPKFELPKVVLPEF